MHDMTVTKVLAQNNIYEKTLKVVLIFRRAPRGGTSCHGHAVVEVWTWSAVGRGGLVEEDD